MFKKTFNMSSSGEAAPPPRKRRRRDYERRLMVVRSDDDPSDTEEKKLLVEILNDHGITLTRCVGCHIYINPKVIKLAKRCRKCAKQICNDCADASFAASNELDEAAAERILYTHCDTQTTINTFKARLLGNLSVEEKLLYEKAPFLCPNCYGDVKIDSEFERDRKARGGKDFDKWLKSQGHVCGDIDFSYKSWCEETPCMYVAEVEE